MARTSKCIKFILHIGLLIIVSHYLNVNKTKRVRKIERFLVDMKHILFWTKFPGLDEEGQEMFIKKNCENFNCYLTMNRTLLGDLRYFDAVIFNVEDLEKSISDLPNERSKVQKYILAANDSADNYPVCSSIYDNYFNWTWTYRFDSSIPFSYISVYNLENQELGIGIQWQKDMKPIDELLKSVLHTKSKAAAIFLDKCDTRSKREVFLRSLQKELSRYNLSVDVFGNCGALKCRRKNMNACYYKLKRTYYFYLALEDSLASDFITSTVLIGYNNNAVPIVYSGASYDRFLPPKSYLEAALLGEAKLAKTMNEIIHNKELYYDYFRWRNYYAMKVAKGMDVCTLCEVMNNPAWLKTRVSYYYLRQWWNPYYEERCGRKSYLTI